MKLYQFCCSGSCPYIEEDEGTVITLVDDFGGRLPLLRPQWESIASRWLQKLPMPLNVRIYHSINQVWLFDMVDERKRVRIPIEQFDELIGIYFKSCEAENAAPAIV